jgi:hypothetical protein
VRKSSNGSVAFFRTPYSQRICQSLLALLTILPLPLRSQALRDSAGFSVVFSQRPLWSANDQLVLSASPRLVFGDTSNPSTRFRQVRGVMRLSDGLIAVADGRSRELRIFSERGQWVRTVPHVDHASGQPLSMEIVKRLRGDTMVISSGLSGVSTYGPRADFLRSISDGDPADLANRNLLLDVLPDGRWLAASPPRSETRSVGVRWTDSLTLRVVAPTQGQTIPIGRFAYVELEQGAKAPSPPWLSAIGAFAAGDDRVYAGFGDRYEIRVFDGKGTPKTIIRRPWTPVAITAEDWERWVVEWSKLWVAEQGAARDSAVNEVRRSPYAEALPAFASFKVDRAGRLWVRHAHWEDTIAAGSYLDRPAVPSEWSVFDSSGRWLGEVTMPANFQAFEIGEDYVAGVLVRDRVAHVAIYGLSSSRR